MSDNLALECGNVAPAKGFQVNFSLVASIALTLMILVAIATIAIRQEWIRLFGGTLMSLFLEIIWLAITSALASSSVARHERVTWRIMLVSISFYMWPWVVTVFYVTFFIELPR